VTGGRSVAFRLPSLETFRDVLPAIDDGGFDVCRPPGVVIFLHFCLGGREPRLGGFTIGVCFGNPTKLICSALPERLQFFGHFVSRVRRGFLERVGHEPLVQRVEIGRGVREGVRLDHCSELRFAVGELLLKTLHCCGIELLPGFVRGKQGGRFVEAGAGKARVSWAFVGRSHTAFNSICEALCVFAPLATFELCLKRIDTGLKLLARLQA
jgi:hypothetical protein